MDVELKKDKGKPSILKDHEVKDLIQKSQQGNQEARELLVQKICG